MDKYNSKEDTFEAFNNKNKAINHFENTGNEVNDSEVPNNFINYFTTIAEKITSQIPNSPSNVSGYLKNRVQSSFFFSPCTPSEISKVIEDLKDNGKGLHIISTSILESCSHIITPILSHSLRDR